MLVALFLVYVSFFVSREAEVVLDLLTDNSELKLGLVVELVCLDFDAHKFVENLILEGLHVAFEPFVRSSADSSREVNVADSSQRLVGVGIVIVVVEFVDALCSFYVSAGIVSYNCQRPASIRNSPDVSQTSVLSVGIDYSVASSCCRCSSYSVRKRNIS